MAQREGTGDRGQGVPTPTRTSAPAQKLRKPAGKGAEGGRRDAGTPGLSAAGRRWTQGTSVARPPPSLAELGFRQPGGRARRSGQQRRALRKPSLFCTKECPHHSSMLLALHRRLQMPDLSSRPHAVRGTLLELIQDLRILR